MGEY
jgi:hypothetical protein